MTDQNKVRTRIAPSPTGEDLHIGNAYTALINYVFAKKYGGDFIIRIEDTDRARIVDSSEVNIFRSLAWLGIPHAEGPDVGGPYAPYRQSERKKIYKMYAQELIAKEHAYYCFCTPQRLEEMRKKQEALHLPPMYDGLCKGLGKNEAKKRALTSQHVVRLSVPDAGKTEFADIIRGTLSFDNSVIDDQVLLKSDGFPTYHLGVVVDDHLMKVSHVIRGEEWISSTPKHVLLYKFFGWQLPVFAHLPVIRNKDRSKLSKRRNPVWVSQYKTQGFLPEALLNYLASLAWSYPDGKEIFSLSEMISVFELSNVQTSAPIFDIDKFRWVNGQYLRAKSDEELFQLLTNFDNSIPKEKTVLQQIFPLIRDRIKTLGEFQSLAGFFFTEPKSFDLSIQKNIISVLINVLSSCNWNHDDIETAIRNASLEKELKVKDVFMQLRVATTGKTVGPPLLPALEILGKENTLKRLQALV